MQRVQIKNKKKDKIKQDFGWKWSHCPKLKFYIHFLINSWEMYFLGIVVFVVTVER